MKRTRRSPRVNVNAEARVWCRWTGSVLLRELTVDTGLVAGWSRVLFDTYEGAPIHQPGRVLADLAVMIGDGGDALTHAERGA